MPLEIWGLKYAECIWVWVYPPKTNIAPETWWGWETTVLSFWETLSSAKMSGRVNWVVVSNIFYFHPYLEMIPTLTNIFQMG